MNENKIKSFTDLFAWQKAHELAIIIYKETKFFPKEEVYGITSQIRRSTISVSSNIAEGFGRQSYKEKIQFYYIAQGSLTELKNQILLARDIKYLDQNKFMDIANKANDTHKLLQGLISASKKFLNPKS